LYERLGRALAAYRKTGLAQRLLECWNTCAAAPVFLAVTIKSMHRYPAMLRLLICNGLQICAVELLGNSARERTRYIKSLS
jgi:hypothetical protein